MGLKELTPLGFNMKSKQILSSIMSMAFFLPSCENSDYKTHSSGFHVPEGDIVVGETLFKEFRCHRCHSITGLEISTHEIVGQQVVKSIMN